MNHSTKRIIATGLVGGLLSGAVKMGWEALVPPRTPKRDEEPPPMRLLKQLGLPSNIKDATYHYRRTTIMVMIFQLQ